MTAALAEDIKYGGRRHPAAGRRGLHQLCVWCQRAARQGADRGGRGRCGRLNTVEGLKRTTGRLRPGLRVVGVTSCSSFGRPARWAAGCYGGGTNRTATV